METSRLLEWLSLRQHMLRRLMLPLLLALIVGVYALVYATGGIKFVYSHSMYIPILLGGLAYGMLGGITVGVLGGLVLGPYMPIDVATGEQQETANWLYRTGFFSLIGFLSGAASDTARAYINQLRWTSRHDAATRLPNRNALRDRLRAIAKNGKRNDPCILAILVIENEMELRSTFGETVIDEVLQQLPARFNKTLHREVPTYRSGSAEIGLLIRQHVHAAVDALDRLVDASRAPFRFNGLQLHADVRMGYVVIEQMTEAPEVYLKMADEALAAALEKAQDKVRHSPSIRTVTQENIAILGELRDAATLGQLSLHYQPKIGIQTRQIHGVEALIRWNHPQRGNIPPGAFIPRAEQSTLINLITEFAMEKAMQQLVEWRKQSIDVSVAVNISTRNLLQPGFSDDVLQLLERYDVGGKSIELEVTEGALMMDMMRTVKELATLANAQIVISVDDFGAGYSSLQYLHLLPISLIKIDQSFVRSLEQEPGAKHIVEAAVTLAHKMGLKVVAEGVENRKSYDFLGDIGCDMAQGYLISRPLPAEDFSNWYLSSGGRYRPGMSIPGAMAGVPGTVFT